MNHEIEKNLGLDRIHKIENDIKDLQQSNLSNRFNYTFVANAGENLNSLFIAIILQPVNLVGYFMFREFIKPIWHKELSIACITFSLFLLIYGMVKLKSAADNLRDSSMQ
jgi:hypothetical protein